MRYFTLGFAAIFFVFGAWLSQKVWADNPAEKEESARQQLRGAVFGFAPWGMTADGQSIGSRALPEGQQYAGVMPDMIEAVASVIDEPIELVPVSYTRMFALLNSGQVDFAFFFRSKDSEKIAMPLVKTHEMRTVIVARPEAIKMSGGSLDRLIFASPRSVRYDPIFDGNQSLERIYTLDYTDAVRLLRKKRVTAIVGPDIFLSYSFRMQNVDAANYVVVQEVAKNDVYLHFSKRSPILEKADKVRAASKALVESGVFEQILTQHFISLEVPFKKNEQKNN